MPLIALKLELPLPLITALFRMRTCRKPQLKRANLSA
jgi:hypothetical protein